MIFHKVTITIKEDPVRGESEPHYSIKINNSELTSIYTRKEMQEWAMQYLLSNLEHSYITNRGDIQVTYTFVIKTQQHITMGNLLSTPEE